MAAKRKRAANDKYAATSNLLEQLSQERLWQLDRRENDQVFQTFKTLNTAMEWNSKVQNFMK